MIEKEVRRSLRRGDLPDGFTMALYSFSPYRACAHDCAYCDGRAEKYYVEGDFARDVVLRRNTVDNLVRELSGLRDRGIVSIGSGVSDVYQPAEAEAGMVGQAAALLAERRLPAVVLTKSSLIERDLDRWRELHRRSGAIVCLTVTTVDDALAAHFEPGASASSARLETLRRLNAAGVPAGVLAMPLLPGLSDGDRAMRELFMACRDCGARFVLPGGLTLRPGRQKEHFMARLDAWRGGLVPEYRRIYAEERASGAPAAAFQLDLERRAAAALAPTGLPQLYPMELHRRMLPPHDELHVLFCHMDSLYRSRGVSTRPLREAAGRYREWLLALRRHFRRQRGLPDDWLAERFQSALDDGELAGVLDNPKLADFARAVFRRGMVLDYGSLALREAGEA